jgi:hypothetical protein
VPAALKDDLAELYQFGCDPLQMAQLNNPNIEFTPQVLPWASAEAEVYRQLSKRIKREIDDDPSQEEYLGRVTEQAVRLATIRAAGIAGHRAKVNADDMTWGADLASILVTNAMNQAQASLPQTPRGQLTENLINFIGQRGLVTVRDVQQHIKGKHSSREITDILGQLVTGGWIVKVGNGYAKAN